MRGKTGRLILFLWVFVFLGAFAFAGGKQEATGKKVVLKFFSYHNVGAIEEKLMQEYANSVGIKAEMISIPAKSYHDKLATSLFSGNPGFDIFWSWQGWTDEFHTYLQDITDQIPADVRNDVVEAAKKAVTYKGRWYGVPMFTAIPVMYYNKNIFAKAGLDPNRPPVNHDELIADAMKTTLDENGDGIPEVYGWGWSGIKFGLMARALEVIYQVGGSWFREENGKLVPNFNNEYGLKMLDVYKKLYMSKFVDPSCINTDEPQLRKAFASGKFAMLEMAGGAVEPFIRKEHPELIGHYGWAPMPGGKGCKGALPGARRSGTVSGSMGPVLVKASKNKKYAMGYLKLMISVEGQKKCLRGYGFAPARKEMVKDAQIIKEFPYIPAVFKAAQYVAPRYPDKYYSAMQSECAPILESYLLGQITAQQCLDKMEKAIIKIRSK